MSYHYFTEIGGFLSREAIFAREKGIPAIVSVDSALSRLKTGDRVKVEAKAGFIKIMST